MEDDSFDIPAIKFAIVYNRYGSCLNRDVNDYGIAIMPFERVDGLTVRQFLNIFEAEDFAHFSYIEKTSKNEKDSLDLSVLFNVCIGKPSQEYIDAEISKYIESLLINNKEVVNPNDKQIISGAICTFCQRYRGRDREEMNNIRRLLLPKKNTTPNA